MPPAFYEWLMHLEAVEKLITTQKYQPKPPHYLFNNRLFQQTGDANTTIREMAVVDAWLATVVRSSVKFTVSIQTLAEMRDQYEKEVEYLLETRPIHLPYEWCTLVLTGLGNDDVVISLMETTAEDADPRAPDKLKSYPELGIEEGEKFISCSLCFYRPVGVEMESDAKIHGDERLSMVPVEIHFNKGELLSETTFLNAVASNIEVRPKGKDTIELVRVCIVNWIASFGLAGMLRRRQHGMTPKMVERVKPLHKRKKWDRPMFEHFVCELEIDLPAPQQAGYHAEQPRKRLHQVRGFPRHLQSGKVVWVKAHWRGDRKLGVVKKDFEMVMHEDDDVHADR
jgi:hypothetical protein